MFLFYLSLNRHKGVKSSINGFDDEKSCRLFCIQLFVITTFDLACWKHVFLDIIIDIYEFCQPFISDDNFLKYVKSWS